MTNDIENNSIFLYYISTPTIYGCNWKAKRVSVCIIIQNVFLQRLGKVEKELTMIIELIGYLGSILVVISMLMTSVIKIRILNCIGSGIFTVYALIIHSYPTAIMNFCLVSINIYYLMKEQEP